MLSPRPTSEVVCLDPTMSRTAPEDFDILERPRVLATNRSIMRWASPPAGIRATVEDCQSLLQFTFFRADFAEKLADRFMEQPEVFNRHLFEIGLLHRQPLPPHAFSDQWRHSYYPVKHRASALAVPLVIARALVAAGLMEVEYSTARAVPDLRRIMASRSLISLVLETWVPKSPHSGAMAKL